MTQKKDTNRSELPPGYPNPHHFFDTILQQKEGFSPYVWEDKAEAFLENNPKIKEAFEEKKATNPAFAANWYTQLDWIHKQSPNYEASHLRYPIIRVGG